MNPPGWYMIQPRGFGPNGESISSPLTCSIFHDTSFHVPTNCSLTEREVRQFGKKNSRLAMRSEAATVTADMGAPHVDLVGGRLDVVTRCSAGAAASS